MKAVPTGLVLLAIGLAGSALPANAWSAEAEPAVLARWEYRVLTRDQVLDLGKKDLAAGLNKLGVEGWELAAIDGVYIFKRMRQENARSAEEVKSLIARIEADVEQWKDRVAWAQRMARKGFLSDREVDAERQQLRRAEIALERARRDLRILSPEQKPPPAKERGREK
jgi:hypothetical protein